MDADRVYRKTAKGSEEIQRRTYRVAPRLRQVLIMVNGEKSAGELARELAALGDIERYLAELEESGFIAHDLEDVLIPPHIDPGTTPRATSTDYDFDKLRSYLARGVLDALGPFSGGLLEQIGRVKTLDDLKVLIPECVRAIENSGGARRSEAFVEGLSATRRNA
jgi:hypothetical protein